jgi:putative spermidine/putrescine transport system permease protein
VTVAAAGEALRAASRPGLAGAREWPLALPLALFHALFFVSPLVLLLAVSFFTTPRLDAVGTDQYVKIFGDPFNWGVLLDTLALGAKTVALTAVIGLPLALLFVEARPRLQAVLLFVIVLPLLTSVVVRTFAWVVILGREGLVNAVILQLGLSPTPLRLLHTELGLLLALSQIELPLMLLPLISVMSRMDPNLRDASAALGAGRWRTLFRVVLPLSLPGLLAGCMLVFASSATAFVSQTVVGGGRLIYLPFYIWQQATTLFHWPFAAALSVLLLLSVAIVIAGLTALARGSRGHVHGEG